MNSLLKLLTCFIFENMFLFHCLSFQLLMLLLAIQPFTFYTDNPGHFFLMKISLSFSLF